MFFTFSFIFFHFFLFFCLFFMLLIIFLVDLCGFWRTILLKYFNLLWFHRKFSCYLLKQSLSFISLKYNQMAAIQKSLKFIKNQYLYRKQFSCYKCYKSFDFFESRISNSSIKIKLLSPLLKYS